MLLSYFFDKKGIVARHSNVLPNSYNIYYVTAYQFCLTIIQQLDAF